MKILDLSSFKSEVGLSSSYLGLSLLAIIAFSWAGALPAAQHLVVCATAVKDEIHQQPNTFLLIAD